MIGSNAAVMSQRFTAARKQRPCRCARILKIVKEGCAGVLLIASIQCCDAGRELRDKIKMGVLVNTRHNYFPCEFHGDLAPLRGYFFFFLAAFFLVAMRECLLEGLSCSRGPFHSSSPTSSTVAYLHPRY
jgi:hypothetical protein